MSDTNRTQWLLDGAWLRRVARALVKHPHLAEDLVQDAWLKSHEHGREAGRVTGTVVDPLDAPLAASTWYVYAREPVAVPTLGAQAASAGPIVTAAGATFEIEGLPVGPIELQLYDKRLGWIEGPVVDVVAGTTVATQIVVGGLEEFASSVVLRARTAVGAALDGPSAAAGDTGARPSPCQPNQDGRKRRVPAACR